MTPDNPQLYRNSRDEGVFYFLGTPTIVRATAGTTRGAFGLIEHTMMSPGFGSPYHVHRREDESFYVLKGRVAFVCDGKWVTAGAGDFVFGPRDVPHGFKVTGTTAAQMLVLATPGGFEGFIEDLGKPEVTPPAPPDLAKLEAVAASYGVEILGPLPEDPDSPERT